MSDDEEEEIITLKQCERGNCGGIKGVVELDDGKLYCLDCRKKLDEAESTGHYRVILTEEEMAKVKLIFDAFDISKVGFWGPKEFNAYISATAENRKDNPPPFETFEAMLDYIDEEFGALEQEEGVNQRLPGLTLPELMNIYGGYVYNGMDALNEDAEVLEDAQILSLAALE